jgi:hypothetical protein
MFQLRKYWRRNNDRKEDLFLALSKIEGHDPAMIGGDIYSYGKKFGIRLFDELLTSSPKD